MARANEMLGFSTAMSGGHGHVNASGFPLQIAVADLVARTSQHHRWKVLYAEHAWRHPGESDAAGFIDLVLGTPIGTGVLVLECKRVRDAAWIFLQPGQRRSVRECRVWVKAGAEAAGRPDIFEWCDCKADPVSPEASYCVVPGQGANDRPLLERVGGELVLATEALAHEERDLFVQQDFRSRVRFYACVIVTTARLELCAFDPAKVNLQDGTVPADATFEVVPFLRFRKQLSTRPHSIAANGWDDPHYQLSHAKERTVFVVNAESLEPFLSSFSVQRFFT
jgi:hypothetical protein